MIVFEPKENGCAALCNLMANRHDTKAFGLWEVWDIRLSLPRDSNIS